MQHIDRDATVALISTSRGYLDKLDNLEAFRRMEDARGRRTYLREHGECRALVGLVTSGCELVR